jgi:hypothetical protein
MHHLHNSTFYNCIGSGFRGTVPILGTLHRIRYSFPDLGTEWVYSSK